MREGCADALTASNTGTIARPTWLCVLNRHSRAGCATTSSRSNDMRMWMTIVGFALTISVPAGIRADDKTSKPDKASDDKTSKSDKSSDDKKKMTDSHFVDHAYTAGQNEVMLGRMA